MNSESAADGLSMRQAAVDGRPRRRWRGILLCGALLIVIVGIAIVLVLPRPRRLIRVAAGNGVDAAVTFELPGGWRPASPEEAHGMDDVNRVILEPISRSPLQAWIDRYVLKITDAERDDASVLVENSTYPGVTDPRKEAKSIAEALQQVTRSGGTYSVTEGVCRLGPMLVIEYGFGANVNRRSRTLLVLPTPTGLKDRQSEIAIRLDGSDREVRRLAGIQDDIVAHLKLAPRDPPQPQESGTGANLHKRL